MMQIVKSRRLNDIVSGQLNQFQNMANRADNSMRWFVTFTRLLNPWVHCERDDDYWFLVFCFYFCAVQIVRNRMTVWCS